MTHGSINASHIPPTHIKPEDKVPLLQKITYGLGGAVDLWGVWIFLILVYPIFNMELKMDPWKIGIMLLVFRLWDSVTDPLMGIISDNTRTRWGRRRPYLFIGAILAGVTYPWMWWAPTTWSPEAMFIWILVSGVVFYSFFTVYNMPYQSLILEMTPDYNERTRVTAWRVFIGKIVGFSLGWVWWFTQLDYFADPTTGEPDAAGAMRIISIGVGIAIILVGVLPAFFVKERYYEHDLAKKQDKLGIWHSLKETLTNGPFLMLTAIATLYMLGILVVDGLANYISTYHVLGGDKKEAAYWLGIGSTITTVIGILSIPLFSWIAEKIGKNKALGIALTTIILGTASTWFIYIPDKPAYMMIYYVTRGWGLSAVWLLIPSIQADVVDYDELNTGERREGSFASIFSWMLKLGMTVAYALSGPILDLTGFDIEFEANQPDGVMLNMRLAFCLVPTVTLLIVGVLLYLFPLTPEKSAEIRAELERRRGKV